MTARFLLRGQLRYLTDQGFDVAVVAGDDDGMTDVAAREGVATHVVPMAREIAPRADVRSLAGLTHLLRRLQPDLVNASTPKAGLLGTVAARLAGVRKRVYTVRGLRLETLTGRRRALMTMTERVAAQAATDVVSVSGSLRAAFSAATRFPEHRIDVLGHGSSNGVDLTRFGPLAAEDRRRARRELGYEDGDFVVGFVGRLTADKGIETLLNAFSRLATGMPRARLLLIGGLEDGDPVSAAAQRRLVDDPAVTWLGARGDPEAFYPLFDVHAFPSRREGFPNAPLEAAACEVPTLGLRVTGTVDAVVHGETGLLSDAGDRDGFFEHLREYATNPDRRRAHGARARQRAVADFSNRDVWSRWATYYRSVLA